MILFAPIEGSFPLYRGSLKMLGSCRGFILLKYARDDNVNLILWNPSTGSHKPIPFSRPYSRCSFLCGFGYDAATDDYLVITIMPLPTGMEFFSLKTNSWNKIEGINYPFSEQYDEVSSAFEIGLFLNGALHWLDLFDGLDVVDKIDNIISFDLIERSLSVIPLPRGLAKTTLDFGVYNMAVNEGCLSLCNCYEIWLNGTSEAVVEIWTMKEYKVQSSWTKSTILITFLTAADNYFLPICFTEGGGIVVGSEHRGVFMKLNCEGKLLDYRKYNPLFVESMSLANPFSIMYRESLLSLPSDIGEANKDDH